MKKYKIKLTKSFIFITILIAIIAATLIFIWSGVIDIGDVFEWIRWFIFSAFLVIIFAIVGALFIGLLLGHKLLSVSGFTPFEEGMLEMKDDIKKINEKLKNIEELLKRK